MGRSQKSLLPKDVEEVLTEQDFNNIFRYLESTFHLSNQWRVEFHSELLRQAREVNAVQFFVEYLKRNVEPAIKHLLKRDDETLVAMMRYVLKEKIATKARSRIMVISKGGKENL